MNSITNDTVNYSVNDSANDSEIHTPFIATIGPEQGGRVDIVGDVHGCFDELCDLLGRMGWHVGAIAGSATAPVDLHHPEGRRLVLTGDLTDTGPDPEKVLRLFLGGLNAGTALSVMGNHCWKILRHLSGRDVLLRDPARDTVDRIKALGPDFAAEIRRALMRAPHQIRVALPPLHPYMDAGWLTVVHAAAPAHHQDSTSKRAFTRAVYGYPTGRTDANDRPERADWAAGYDGLRPVVHGHTPRRNVRIRNRVMCLDTGCVFGNALSAYRPDLDSIVRVAARRDHSGEKRDLEYL